MTTPSPNENEKLLMCRCAECETGKQRGCNSSRLKELLDNLFDEDLSIDNAQGLFCQRTKALTASVRVIEESECLCVECELREGKGKHFCKSPGVSFDENKPE